MKPLLNVLFCDDDNHFAVTQSKSLQHKLETRHGITPAACHIQTLSSLDRLLQISGSKESLEWDCIFCDLGWSNLTLEGIQILNNIQLSHPQIFTVLYTAQNEDEIISQALRWKLDFIDRILKIEDSGYFDAMLQILKERFENKRSKILAQTPKAPLMALLEELKKIVTVSSQEQVLRQLKNWLQAHTLEDYPFPVLFPKHFTHIASGNSLEMLKGWVETMMDEVDAIQSAPNVTLRGLRLLPKESRTAFSQTVGKRLQELQLELISLVENNHKDLSADICIAKGTIEMKLRLDPQTQQSSLFQELTENLRQFPNIAPHALLGLEKASYIEYVLKTYGGFPAMAEERSLDLNHIYRVNRKFKQVPFIVFRFDTIQEIIGIYEAEARNAILQTLLLPPEMLRLP